MTLAGKKVLVTGATGFIGGRLVERLLLKEQVAVRALVRSYTHASRLGRFPLEILKGDLANPAVVEAAMVDCEIVFHLAHDFATPTENLKAAQTIIAAAQKRGVKIVYTSTIEVYGWATSGEVDETAPRYAPPGNSYAKNKIALEKLFLEAKAAVLQPTIVYGPYSYPWTVYIAEMLKSGQPVALINNGAGTCNAVYIDDVIQALLLAAETETALGEAFLISAVAPITWRTFFDRFEAIVGKQATVPLSAAEYQALTQPKSRLNKFLRRYIDIMQIKAMRQARWADYGYRTLRFVMPHGLWVGLQTRVKGGSTSEPESPLKQLQATLVAHTPQMILPPAFNVPMYEAQLRVKIDKARRILGYEPQYDFEAGMALTAQYLEWANLKYDPS